jgi:Integrase zinc binding domain
MKYFRHLILSNKKVLRVFTDHKNLCSWTKFKVLKYRHFRWLEGLSEYRFVVDYIPGYGNIIADGLSRKSLKNEKIGDGSHEGVHLLRDTNLSIGVLGNQRMAGMVDSVGLGGLDIARHDRVRLQGDMATCYDSLSILHSQYGHPGIAKMISICEEEGMGNASKSFIKDICLSCSICQIMKHRWGKRGGLMRLFPTPNRVGEALSIDIFGPLGFHGVKCYTAVLVCRV